ncbi:MAG: signal peptidase I [Lachnospiraceae bacterium]|nr:signal peptidase I [Lachnospiraceae bacterium]
MKNILKEVLSTSLYLLVVLLITFLVVRYVGQRTEVVGSSMENTLQDGDNLLVDKISYRFKDPERFDIIVFPYQHEKETYYIKRIIGMPGETIQIDSEGNISVDGQILEEYYGKDIILDPGRAISEIELSEDEYFVLGDNRNNSTDSRAESVGNIHRDDILGKAFIRIWPLSKLELLKHQ